jgi:hypothetical protein
MFLDWSNVCCPVLPCYYCVQSGTFNVAVVKLLTQGVDTASINQSFKIINGDLTFLQNVPIS